MTQGSNLCCFIMADIYLLYGGQAHAVWSYLHSPIVLGGQLLLGFGSFMPQKPLLLKDPIFAWELSAQLSLFPELAKDALESRGQHYSAK